MSETSAPRPEPRWPAIMAVLSVGGLYWALPEALSPGPGWLALALVAPLSMVGTVLHRQRKLRLNQIVGYTVLGLITAAMIGALVLLIAARSRLGVVQDDALKVRVAFEGFDRGPCHERNLLVRFDSGNQVSRHRLSKAWPAH